MSETASTPSLSALLQATVRNYMRNVFTILPARIQTYSPGTRKATIELLVLDVEQTRLGTTSTPFQIVNEVPIVFPGRSGAFIEWTPQPGDNVLALFSTRSLDLFLKTGGLVDPDDVRMHDINDAIALPVASFDFAHVASAAPQIKFTGTTIEAGGVAPLALNADLSTVINKVNSIITAYNAHIHPATSGTTSPTASQVVGALAAVTGTGNLKGG